MAIPLLSTLFLLLTGVMAIAVLGLFLAYLKGRTRIFAIAAFLLWLLYIGVLGYTGVVASKSPPGPAFLVAPFFLFVIAFLTRHPGVRAFAQKVPAALLLGLQVFRVFVELALHQLYILHLVPRMLTFEGANFDILIGLTAPLLAWLSVSKRVSLTVVRVWSFFGIALLANVVIRALLTFPGPLNLLKTEVPNTAIGIFPFTYLPGFLAPLALSLHILFLRSLPTPSRAPKAP